MTDFFQTISEEDFYFFVVLELKSSLEITEDAARNKIKNWRMHNDMLRQDGEITRNLIVEKMGFEIMRQEMARKND